MNTVILIDVGAILFLTGYIVGMLVTRRAWQISTDDAVTEFNGHLHEVARAYESDIARIIENRSIEASVINEITARRYDPLRQS